MDVDVELLAVRGLQRLLRLTQNVAWAEGYEGFAGQLDGIEGLFAGYGLHDSELIRAASDELGAADVSVQSTPLSFAMAVLELVRECRSDFEALSAPGNEVVPIFEDAVACLQGADYRSFWSLLRGISQKGSPFFPEGSFDAFFIDGAMFQVPW